MSRARVTGTPSSLEKGNGWERWEGAMGRYVYVRVQGKATDLARGNICGKVGFACRHHSLYSGFSSGAIVFGRFLCSRRDRLTSVLQVHRSGPTVRPAHVISCLLLLKTMLHHKLQLTDRWRDQTALPACICYTVVITGQRATCAGATGESSLAGGRSVQHAWPHACIAHGMEVQGHIHSAAYKSYGSTAQAIALNTDTFCREQ